MSQISYDITKMADAASSLYQNGQQLEGYVEQNWRMVARMAQTMSDVMKDGDIWKPYLQRIMQNAAIAIALQQQVATDLQQEVTQLQKAEHRLSHALDTSL